MMSVLSFLANISTILIGLFLIWLLVQIQGIIRELQKQHQRIDQIVEEFKQTHKITIQENTKSRQGPLT